MLDDPDEVQEYVTTLDRLRAELVAKDARIAEWQNCHKSALDDCVRLRDRAEKAYAKLDTLQRTYQFDVGRLVSERDQEKSRAERAEAERDAMSLLVQHFVWAVEARAGYTLQLQMIKARAALKPPTAGREP